MQKHETIKRILTIAFLATVAVLVSGCNVFSISVTDLDATSADNWIKIIKQLGIQVRGSIKTFYGAISYTWIGLTFMFVCIGVFFLVKARKVWKSMKTEK